MNQYSSLIGYSGGGYNIVGAGMDGGYPMGTPFVAPRRALAPWAAQAIAAVQQQGADPQTAMAQVVSQFGDACFGAPVAPLAVQQVQEPLLGIEPRCPTNLDIQLIGLGECCIDPCKTARLKSSPCNTVKITRFVIPSSVAYQLRVDQITINGRIPLINNGPVSGAMFVEDSTLPDMIATPTLQQGCCIEIQLTNIGESTVRVIVSGQCRIWY